MRFFVFLIFFFLFNATYAFTLRGRITYVTGEKLPYVNIYVKGTSNGTSANAEGEYALELPAGKYEIVFQHIGYKTRTESIDLKANMTLNVSLEVLQYEIKDVIINGNEDPAYEVIRKAIKRRKYFLDAVESYSCDAYVKGMQRLDDVPPMIRKRLKSNGITMTSNGIVYLSESVSKLYYKKPGKFHEVVTSSKVSGSSQTFTFNNAQSFYFNFYERSIPIQLLAQTPFISPLSDNTFTYYKFKMLGAYKEGDRLINKIQVIPKSKTGPCFSGVLSIVEDNWNIHSLELYLTKNNGIQYLDTLKVTQYFIPVKDDLWLPSQQRYDARLNFFNVTGTGYYLGIFKNYQLNNLFAANKKTKTDSNTVTRKNIKKQQKQEQKAEQKLFTAEIIKVEQGANKRDSVYWDSIRPIPLTEIEVADYSLKDSIQTIRDSKAYKDSTDKFNNKPTVGSMLLGYTYRKQFKKLSVTFPSLLNIVNFNTVEGVNLQLKFRIQKTFKEERRRIVFEPVLRYGFTNKQFNAMAVLSFRNSQVNDEWFSLSGGRFISQFNESQPQKEFGNTWQSLVFRNNFMKIYEHYFVRLGYSRELYNGIFGNFALYYTQNSPLENTNHFSFFPKIKRQYTPNGMDLPNLTAETDNFSAYNNFRIDVRLKFNFGQKYITRPDFKIRTSSKYPELTIIYRRGIPIAKFSDLNFDYLEAQLRGYIDFKLGGITQYRFGGGGFPYAKRVEFPDYKHFYGNFLTTGQTELVGFNLIRYNRHSTKEYFAEAHLEHHFGGIIFNKIPGWNKLKFQEVIGFHFLYTPTRKQYFQIDAGIENILKIARVDFNAGFGSGFKEYYFGARIALAIDVGN